MSVFGLMSGGVEASEAGRGREHGSRPDPIVIAHRGASGYVPEHTLAAYGLAVQQGADYIEPDLVLTKDGVLVARHENEIGGTTDVADHPDFARRRTTKTIDGAEVSGWFTEDFTLAELKRLRARERIPKLRPANTRFNGQFEVPTFEEILTLVRGLDSQRAAAAKQGGQPAPAAIGIYPETKHPTYFERLGLPHEKPLLDALARHGYRDASAPVFIQSFETGNLRALRTRTKLRLIQLLASEGAPYDFVARGDARSYADLITPAGLAEIATYADGIGPEKVLVIPRSAEGFLASPTNLVANAHAAGLAVHAWTFRAENTFLPRNFVSGEEPAGVGDLAAEVATFVAAGLDGVFADQPDRAVLGRAAARGGK